MKSTNLSELHTGHIVSTPEGKKARLISKKGHKLTVVYRDKTLGVFDESEVVHIKDHTGKERRKEEKREIEQKLFINDRLFKVEIALHEVQPKDARQVVAKTRGRVGHILTGILPDMKVIEDSKGPRVLSIGSVGF